MSTSAPCRSSPMWAVSNVSPTMSSIGWRRLPTRVAASQRDIRKSPRASLLEGFLASPVRLFGSDLEAFHERRVQAHLGEGGQEIVADIVAIQRIGDIGGEEADLGAAIEGLAFVFHADEGL